MRGKEAIHVIQYGAIIRGKFFYEILTKDTP